MSVVRTRSARQDLRRLNPDLARRVIAAVDALATDGQGDVQRRRHPDHEWRVRIGDRRIRFTFDTEGAMLILRVLPRGRACQP